MVFKALLFDLDGTLVTTSPGHRYLAVGQTLEELGRSSTRESMDRFWFETRRDDVIKDEFGLEPEVFWKTFRKYDTIDLRQRNTHPYADIGFVVDLHARGYKTGILTGAPSHIRDLEVGLIGREYFDVVITAQESFGLRLKPDPLGLELCLRLLGVSHREALYVGNADEDIWTAKNAHVLDVLVVRGEYQHIRSEPSVRINSLYELSGILL